MLGRNCKSLSRLPKSLCQISQCRCGTGCFGALALSSAPATAGSIQKTEINWAELRRYVFKTTILWEWLWHVVTHNCYYRSWLSYGIFKDFFHELYGRARAMKWKTLANHVPSTPANREAMAWGASWAGSAPCGKWEPSKHVTKPLLKQLKPTRLHNITQPNLRIGIHNRLWSSTRIIKDPFWLN